MSRQSASSGGKGETILYHIGSGALGAFVIAATDRGICAVMLGQGKAELLGWLRGEFPKAELTPYQIGASGEMDNWMEAAAAYLGGEAARPELPLDLRGTDFQIKVWHYLLSLKDNQTVSYSDVAAAIGRPKAVRAAASACGKNRIAVLVPCHLVVRSDGGLGGYRWGLARKRELLRL